jgi:hypothetical protein
MDLNKLAKRAKRIVDQRGGVESLKQDASELRDIASQPGSLRDKAKAAAAALKDPGTVGDGAEASAGAPTPTEPAAPPAPAAPPEPAGEAGTGDQPS